MPREHGRAPQSSKFQILIDLLVGPFITSRCPIQAGCEKRRSILSSQSLTTSALPAVATADRPRECCAYCLDLGACVKTHMEIIQSPRKTLSLTHHSGWCIAHNGIRKPYTRKHPTSCAMAVRKRSEMAVHTRPRSHLHSPPPCCSKNSSCPK